MLFEEILIVKHDKVYFGIPTIFVGQILRIPEMTHLAMSPPVVRGLCAVVGNIITVVDMNLLLGLNEVDTSSGQSRILSMNDPFSTSALMVSEVLVPVTIETENIEYIDNATDAIVAVYKYGENLIQVIDIEKLFEVIHVQKVIGRNIVDKSSKFEISIDKNIGHERYLVFRMGGEMYAILIDYLREILGAHHSLSPITGACDEIIGMMSLRHELLVIADLRVYFGFEPRESDKNRIMLVQSNDKMIGLMIDEIVDIREFRSDCVDLNDGILFGNSISGVIHDNTHLISLIGKETIDRIVERNETIIVANKEEKMLDTSEAVIEVVIFKLGGAEYAFPIEGVSEIIDMAPITPVASSSASVEGIMNIRGQIVTIGSLHKRLGIVEAEGNEQKIIICQAQKGRIGFFVESVSDVMVVKLENIRIEQDKEGLFSGVLHLSDGNRLVMLFDLDALHLIKGRE